MKSNTFHARKVLVALFAMLMPLLASADPVEIDGIWYNLVAKAKQAEVTRNPSWYSFEGLYSDSIAIPATVTHEGVEYSVTKIGDEAFRYCERLTSVTIPEGVTSIGKEAFYYCKSLTSVTIPEGVTSIGDHAFLYCESLVSIVIPEGVLSMGNQVFKDCVSLVDVVLPSSLTSFGGIAFKGCTSLASIAIPKGVEEIGYQDFYGCTSLTNLVIPEGVKRIETEAFKGCTSLTTITLPKSLREIYSEAFANCTSLTDVYCYVTSNVSSYINAFDGSYIEYATLHVPSSMLYAYKATKPWSNFGKFETFEVPVSVSEIILNHVVVKLEENETLKLNATVKPDDAKDKSISWSSSDSTIVTVDAEGMLTGVAPGSAFIIATANDGSEVTAVCVVTVVPASYVITFLVDGEVYATETLTRGEAVNTPKEPTKKGYTFSGWGEVPATMPAYDVTINATFTVNKYLVTFKIDGEVIASDSLEYGASIVVPEVPEKEGYTFSGWGKVAETVPANDLTYEGGYTINSYLLTYTVDGETVQTESVVYGSVITALDEPNKEGYTFSGWSDIPATMPANDVAISGTFIPNKYLVTFKIGDEVIASDSLEYGAAIVAPDAPEKEGYTFNGWGDVAETVPAGDVTYVGGYTINSYLLTYTVDGEVVQADSVVYGSAITALDEPNKEGYTFSGWSDIPATMPASDVTINGAFIINKYLVTFKIGDEVIASDSLEYGAAIVAPDAPEKEGYTFNGWGDVAETVPAGDVTYEGSYTVNVYNVYYYVGEELVHTAEVAYGEAIPEYMYEPTEEGCTFLGWVGESYDAMPAHDVTYTANIDNGIDQFIIDNSQLTIYDLTGRRVLNTENLKGGIYIVNGRKVIVK